MTKRDRKPDFYPPKLTLPLVQLCQFMIPFVGDWYYRMRLEITQESLDQLRQLKGKRVLLLPNHPTFHDWIAIFLLSSRVNDSFYYMAAYERFYGLKGEFLQRLGAYSIRRGLGDRPSVAQTLDLLVQPDCRLVIFPEGGCSFQNDTIMPFRTGAVQVALQAMNRLVKQGQDVPDLYVVPISVKYRYLGDMAPVIHNTLSRLERSLHIPRAATPYARLRAVAERVLVSIEKDYGLHNEIIAQQPWNDRIPKLKNHALQECERVLGIIPSPNDPIRERVYRLQYTLESRAETLAEDNFWTYDSIHQTAARLLNFDSIYDGYVADHPTPERFLDTLIRLERAVFKIDQPTPKGHRKVYIQVDHPLNLKDYFADYQRDRTGAIALLTEKLRQTIQENLNQLLKL